MKDLLSLKKSYKQQLAKVGKDLEVTKLRLKDAEALSQERLDTIVELRAELKKANQTIKKTKTQLATEKRKNKKLEDKIKETPDDDSK